MSASDPRTEGYERSDVHARPVALFALVLSAILAGSMVFSAWLSGRVTDELRGLESPNPLRDLRRPPEGPELQPIPAQELEQHRAWEERLLTATEWVDPLNGVVRIPVEQALELSLREGFPTRAKSQGGGR